MGQCGADAKRTQRMPHSLQCFVGRGGASPVEAEGRKVPLDFHSLLLLRRYFRSRCFRQKQSPVCNRGASVLIRPGRAQYKHGNHKAIGVFCASNSSYSTGARKNSTPSTKGILSLCTLVYQIHPSSVCILLFRQLRYCFLPTKGKWPIPG